MKRREPHGGRQNARGEDARGNVPRRHQRREQTHRDSHGAAERRGAARIDVVFGVHPVGELVETAPAIVRVLYVRRGDEQRFAREADRVRAAGGTIVIAEPKDFERLCGPEARHQGIAARISEYRYASFEDVLAEKPDPIVVVDGVTDPRNLGAILRAAEGAGAATIVLARDRTVAVTPAVVKSSAGAWAHVKIARCGNVAQSLERLKQAGYWIAALVPGGAISLYSLDTTRRLAIVVGAEDTGVRDIVKRTSDFTVDIPMRGKVSSLNVSVAAAVALFEIARRRAEAARQAQRRDLPGE